MKTILVVEDEWAILEVVVEVLENEGYYCVHAVNGKEGLERLEETKPDLVLLDVMMPVLDGREMLRRLRADPRFQDTPVILMSAGGGIPEQTGPTTFLQKPFGLDRLLAVVARLLDNNKEEGVSPGV
jgi:CheY-like chemotaxis protein